MVVSTLLSPLPNSYEVCSICGLNPKSINVVKIVFSKAISTSFMFLEPIQLGIDLGIHTVYLGTKLIYLRMSTYLSEKEVVVRAFGVLSC